MPTFFHFDPSSPTKNTAQFIVFKVQNSDDPPLIYGPAYFISDAPNGPTTVSGEKNPILHSES